MANEAIDHKSNFDTKFLDSVAYAHLDDFYHVVLDQFPCLVFVVEQDVRIVDFNRIAGDLLAKEKKELLSVRLGEAIHCLHSMDVMEGCGRGPACRDCVVRNSVNRSLGGRSTIRRKISFTTTAGEKETQHHFFMSTAPFAYADRQYVLLILDDVRESVLTT